MSTSLPVLYRGDSVRTLAVPGQIAPCDRGRTFPETFVTEGVLAKSGDGGWSADEQRPLAYLVAAHIGYERDSEEQRISFRSPFISFSTRIQDALHFADRTHRKQFEPCGFEKATHFVWRLEGVAAVEVSPGCHHYSFTASLRNVDRFLTQSLALVHQGQEDEITRALARQIVFGHIRNDERQHEVLVLEAATYLQNLATLPPGLTPALRRRAIELATQWSEWLVIPVLGFSGELPVGYLPRLHHHDYLHPHAWMRSL